MEERLTPSKQQKPKGYKTDFQDDVEGNTLLKTITTQQGMKLEIPAVREWSLVEKIKLKRAKEELEKIEISQISKENVSLALGGISGGAMVANFMSGDKSNLNVIYCAILAAVTVGLFSYGYIKRSEVKNDIMLHVEKIKLYLNFDEEEEGNKSEHK